MKHQDRIRALITGISSDATNRTGEIFLNVIKNEFIILDGMILIPHVSVKELDYETGVLVLTDLFQYIPEYLVGHEPLHDRWPASDQHSLQFIKRMKGKLLEFVHFFKIDLRYGGGGSDVVNRGTTDLYPSYYTDRIYYKSRLIPVAPSRNDDGNESFEPVRIFDQTHTESDQHFYTFAIFEDINTSEITREMYEKMNFPEIFSISNKVYPFIEYIFYTFAMNILNPVGKELEMGVKIFEPLFLSIYQRYRGLTGLCDLNDISEHFTDEFDVTADGISFKESFILQMSKYFARFSVHRDDELYLKGWWRINYDPIEN